MAMNRSEPKEGRRENHTPKEPHLLKPVITLVGGQPEKKLSSDDTSPRSPLLSYEMPEIVAETPHGAKWRLVWCFLDDVTNFFNF